VFSILNVVACRSPLDVHGLWRIPRQRISPHTGSVMGYGTFGDTKRPAREQ
jgi:hypothetical protein